jgi:hypothetical protein
MVLRLSSPAARMAPVLSYSGMRDALAARETELNTSEGYLRAMRLGPDDATNCYLLGGYRPYSLEESREHTK